MLSVAKNKNNVTLVMFIVVLTFATAVHLTNAQGLAVKIQPSTIDEKMDPGQLIRGELTVTNESTSKQTYFISTRNVTSMDDSGRPIFSDVTESDPLEAAAWIKPEFQTIELEGSEKITIPYTIDIPLDASPGSHFAAIFVTREADTATESGAGVGFTVGSLVNLRVSGEALEGLKVLEFFTDKSVYTTPVVKFTAQMENTGTIHQRPIGVITIMNMFGKEIKFEEALKMNENAGGLMPRTTRSFNTTWTAKGFEFGRYSALLSTVYGESQRFTITREVTFWILLLKEIGLTIAGLVGLLLISILAIRAYIRRALERAGVNASLDETNKIKTFSKRLIRMLVWFMLVLAVMFIGVIVFFA